MALVDPQTGVAAPLPPLQLRHPYLGHGADGARRCAQIDQEEADTLDVGDQRDEALLSVERWLMQAEYLEEHDHRPAPASASTPATTSPTADPTPT